MAQWKQFGDVILNLDRVIKVERRGDAVKVYLAGLLPTTQTGGLGASDATPGARTFGGDEARRVWAYFHGLSKAAGAGDDADAAASHVPATPSAGAAAAAAPTMHTIMPVVRPTAPSSRPPAAAAGPS
jgi:hypothetical protein